MKTGMVLPDALESLEQPFDLVIPSVQFFRDPEPVRHVVLA